MIDLEAIFGEGPAVDEAPVPAGPADAAAAGVPRADLGRFADWVLRPDSRGVAGWQSPDALDPWPAWEDLPTLPDPCPKCGSLELWQTVAGTWRCQRCERAAFERGLRLAERAARLRGGGR